MLSIGQQLSRARTARDLTIEDVAFQTRIPAAKVRDMENDDLSRFANLTYARGFLKIYSQFLELDIRDYLEQFSTAELAHASGHEYVQMANATQNLPAAVFTDYGRARRPGVYILLALLLAGGAVIWWNQRDKPDGTAESDKVVDAKNSAVPELEPEPVPPVPPADAKPPKATVVEEDEETPAPNQVPN